MNVLAAAHERDGARLRPKGAGDAVVATLCFGVMLELGAPQSKTKSKTPLTPGELADVLRQKGADLLFRVASGALADGAAPKVKSAKKMGLLYSAEELQAAIR